MPYIPQTQEEIEEKEIKSAKFKVKQLRQIIIDKADSDKMNWRLYKKGFLGLWWWVGDYKWFTSVEEIIQKLVIQKYRKDCFEKQRNYYFNIDGKRINRKDSNPK